MPFIFLQTISKLQEKLRFYFLVILVFCISSCFPYEDSSRNTIEIVLFDHLIMSFTHLKSVKGVLFIIEINILYIWKSLMFWQ